MISKKIGMLGVLFTMLFSVQAVGNGYYGGGYWDQSDSYNGCNDCCDDWCSGWAVYADWLYWSPRRCQLDYAVPKNPDLSTFSANHIKGEVQSVHPKYESGYRVGLFKDCGCSFIEAYYTHFSVDESDEFRLPQTNDFLIFATRIPSEFTGTTITEAGFELAQAKWELDYDTGDIIAGFRMRPCCCLETIFFGGFKLAYIDQKLDSRYQVSLTSPDVNFVIVDERINLHAYGVEFGLGYNYSIWSCFNFFGNVSLDFLAGDFKRQYQSFVTGDTGITREVAGIHDDCWAAVTVANVSFGLGYNYDFCGCWVQNIGIFVGYEFHQWMNMLDFLDVDGTTPTDVATLQLDRHVQSFGVDGLYVRFAVGF